MKTKEELQAIYFGFYDQLPEPWRSEAKENWDYEFAKERDIPKTVDEAVCNGFDWGGLHDSEVWATLCHQLQKGLNVVHEPIKPTLSDIKNQLDRVEVLLNKLIEKK